MMATVEWKGFAETLRNEATTWDLFTVLEVDWADGLVRRSYSSDECSYPSGGTKKLMDSEWAKHVIHRQNVFSANDEMAFRSAFADYELLESMGLRFALNLPIVEKGRTVRTLNLLRSTPAFGEKDLSRVFELLENLLGTIRRRGSDD